MRKTIWTGTCSVIVGIAAAVATAQTTSPPQTSSPPQANSAPPANSITVTGCLKEAPAAWLDAVADALAADDPALVYEAVTTARAVVGPKQRSEKLTRSEIESRKPRLPCTRGSSAGMTTCGSLRSNLTKGFRKPTLKKSKPSPAAARAM